MINNNNMQLFKNMLFTLFALMGLSLVVFSTWSVIFVVQSGTWLHVIGHVASVTWLSSAIRERIQHCHDLPCYDGIS